MPVNICLKINPHLSTFVSAVSCDKKKNFGPNILRKTNCSYTQVFVTLLSFLEMEVNPFFRSLAMV